MEFQESAATVHSSRMIDETKQLMQRLRDSRYHDESALRES
jgi:hypothetical protein